MVVRRFNFKGKPVYLDELFNISADKEQDKHLGVLQVKADGSEFYIAPKVRRTKEALKDSVERENFQEAKALFVKMVQQAAAKKIDAALTAPARAPVAPVAAPVVVPRPVVMSERGGVTVKKQVGRLLTASQQEELEERREAAARLRYEKEEREAEQAYYMAAE